jgi:Na+/melibiose symporter-like transporter
MQDPSRHVANTDKPLGGWLKLAYGMGLSAEGIKNNAFNLFLLFYYQQIVGLDSALCGLALFIALCFDGIVDPAIGVWSDGLKSRLGRRHPFMYASSFRSRSVTSRCSCRRRASGRARCSRG